MSAARRGSEPSAIALIEEAVHLLRRAPAATWAIYCAGAVPFTLGVLFFWAHTAWFRPPAETIAWGALGLTGLFAAMKAAQAEFCARLMAQRLGDAPPPCTVRRLAALVLAQVRVQPWVMLLLAPALVLTVPFGWLYAYGQNATVLGADARLHEEAAAQARLWPAQNHLGLLLLSVVSLAAWLNLAIAFWMVPWLANRLLGLDNIFGLTGWWFANTTFLASVTALAWLAVDPLVKAFYTLRVFHGRARRTGEDVRVEMRLARSGPALRAAAVTAVLLALAPAAPDARAAEAPATAVQPAELDQAIERVLAGGDFRWRLPPAAEPDAGQDGPLTKFFRKGMDSLRDAGRAIERGWKRVTDWWERIFPKKDKQAVREMSSSAGVGLGAVQVMLYLFIAAAVLLIAWVIWLMVKQGRAGAAPVLAARAVSLAQPDLKDDNVQAALLPADGWLALAREQAAKGEWRLAWRALYLATLARLAAEGLLSLAKSKTNLDYERELRRRALSRTEIVARFAARRRGFEDVWYGRAEPAAAAVREWMAELERPAAP